MNNSALQFGKNPTSCARSFVALRSSSRNLRFSLSVCAARSHFEARYLDLTPVAGLLRSPNRRTERVAGGIRERRSDIPAKERSPRVYPFGKRRRNQSTGAQQAAVTPLWATRKSQASEGSPLGAHSAKAYHGSDIRAALQNALSPFTGTLCTHSPSIHAAPQP